MQVNLQEKFPPIKGRVHNYLINKGISIKKISQELEISPTAFSGKSAKSEFGGEIIATIVRKFPTISAEWLLTGVGCMEKTPQANIINTVRGNNNTNTNNTHINTLPQGESVDLEWVLREIEIKNTQISEKDEQIRRLTEALNTQSISLNALLAKIPQLLP